MSKWMSFLGVFFTFIWFLRRSNTPWQTWSYVKIACYFHTMKLTFLIFTRCENNSLWNPFFNSMDKTHYFTSEDVRILLYFSETKWDRILFGGILLLFKYFNIVSVKKNIFVITLKLFDISRSKKIILNIEMLLLPVKSVKLKSIFVAYGLWERRGVYRASSAMTRTFFVSHPKDAPFRRLLIKQGILRTYSYLRLHTCL